MAIGIPLEEEDARCFSPPAPQGVLPGLLCLRKAEGAKTMPRGGRQRGNGRGVCRPPLPLALPHGSARSATTRTRAARGGRGRRDLSHNERPWGLTTPGAPCQRRAVRYCGRSWDTPWRQPTIACSACGVRDKECSLAIAAPQPMENRQRSSEIFAKKHDMKCTTAS